MPDKLILLEPGFADPAHPGERFVCPHSNAIEGLLAAFPELASGVEVERVPFPRPRSAVIELLGEENQSLPVLVLDGPPAGASVAIEEHAGRPFVSSTEGILSLLAERHGFPRLHP